LGIGGIGMSALAKFFHLQGKIVSGYDRVSSIVTKGLEEMGMKVWYELDAKHLQGNDLIVYTPAIPNDNVELCAAFEMGIPVLKRSQVLGYISQKYKAIGIAGTHGKTTTSSMMTHVLRYCGIDCTAFLGGIARNLQSNFVDGASDWVVIEADEFDRSFLTLYPEIGVVTSLDADHLDIYGTPEEMRATYHQYTQQVNESGRLFVHADLMDETWQRAPVSYGIEQGVFRAENLVFKGLKTYFDFVGPDIRIPAIALTMPGKHNVSNMVGALAVALELGGDTSKMKAAVESFAGIYRRYEAHFHTPMLSYIDDYAHLPAEIDAAIDTTKALFPDRQMVVVFQPHLFTRTRDFFKEFGSALSKADVAIMLDIYPAREEPIEGVDSGIIFREIETNHKKWIAKKKLAETLTSVVQSPTVILSLGAGDIDREVEKIKNWCTNQVS